MKIEEVKKVAVIGAGIMGSQIAEILSRLGGYEVTLCDIKEEMVQKGLQEMEERLEVFFVAKGRLTADESRSVLDRVKGSTNLEDSVKDADIVIEAIPENVALKKELFQKLDKLAPPRAIFTSNTSYQNITEIASSTQRQDKFIGTHFFNPLAVLTLLEVEPGSHTSKETSELICKLAEKLGKEPIICKDWSYGFLANRLYTAMQLEAVQMLWERVASPAEIDRAAMIGYGLPRGPLEVTDIVSGWSVIVASEEDAMREQGPEKGHLHPLIRMMTRAGYKNIYKFWEDILSKW